jgi:hypothetical protein
MKLQTKLYAGIVLALGMSAAQAAPVIIDEATFVTNYLAGDSTVLDKLKTEVAASINAGRGLGIGAPPANAFAARPFAFSRTYNLGDCTLDFTNFERSCVINYYGNRFAVPSNTVELDYTHGASAKVVDGTVITDVMWQSFVAALMSAMTAVSGSAVVDDGYVDLGALGQFYWNNSDMLSYNSDRVYNPSYTP